MIVYEAFEAVSNPKNDFYANTFSMGFFFICSLTVRYVLLEGIIVGSFCTFFIEHIETKGDFSHTYIEIISIDCSELEDENVILSTV